MIPISAGWAAVVQFGRKNMMFRLYGMWWRRQNSSVLAGICSLKFSRRRNHGTSPWFFRWYGQKTHFIHHTVMSMVNQVFGWLLYVSDDFGTRRKHWGFLDFPTRVRGILSPLKAVETIRVILYFNHICLHPRDFILVSVEIYVEFGSLL